MASVVVHVASNTAQHDRDKEQMCNIRLSPGRLLQRSKVCRVVISPAPQILTVCQNSRPEPTEAYRARRD